MVTSRKLQSLRADEVEGKEVMTLIGIGGQVKCKPLRYSPQLSCCLSLHVVLFYSNLTAESSQTTKYQKKKKNPTDL